MPKRADQGALAAEIHRRLLSGPLGAVDLYRPLGISQSTFSRTLASHGAQVLAAGRASNTRYALRRRIPGMEPPIAAFEIDEAGKTARFGEFHAVHPRGFYFQSAAEDRRPSRFFADLPYFLDDLRPGGFLGRLIPKRHPELELPRDVRAWTSDDCLRYLTRYGTDLIGNLILGDEAFRRHLDEGREAPAAIALDARRSEYPKRAQAVLEYGDPGSSAGGEQPKFSAIVGPGRLRALVKFSPKPANDVARRRADLLLCEHLALAAMARAGHRAAKSEVLLGGGQVFLQVERFDRVPPRGRRGLISLLALDAELVGRGGSWGAMAERLLLEDRIDRATRDQIRWRELFGHLIGNTDMHQANLSFYFQEPAIIGLAPAYDMLPMLYAPQNEQLIERVFDPPSPSPQDAGAWEGACGAAAEFWEAVAADARVSPGFRSLARQTGRRVRSLSRLKELLP